MKKITVRSPHPVKRSTPENAGVFRLELKDGALLVRFFDFRLDNDETPVTGLLEVQVGAHSHMREVVVEDNCVAAEELSVPAEVAVGRNLKEVGRFIFNPSVGGATVVGAGEKKDFAAFILARTPDGDLLEPYNHFAESASTKGTVNRTGRVRNAMMNFVLYSDSSTAPISDWTILTQQQNGFFLNDATDGEWEYGGDTFNVFSLLPTVELVVTPGSGISTVGVNIKRAGVLVDYSGELVVEPVAGYVPNTRVTIFNGAGSFKVMPLGLVSGEFARVKIGTKTLSGMADISIPVE
jgi:hypothetical protein